MKWEYFVADNDERLSELGEQGWELVTAIPYRDQFKFYFKKPQQTLKERITENQRDEVYRQLNSRDHT